MRFCRAVAIQFALRKRRRVLMDCVYTMLTGYRREGQLLSYELQIEREEDVWRLFKRIDRVEQAWQRLWLRKTKVYRWLTGKNNASHRVQ